MMVNKTFRESTENQNHMPYRLLKPLILTVTLGLVGCATNWRPIADTTRVALAPSKGEITMAARPGKAIGGVLPVNLAVANGTDEPYRIEPDQVFAIDAQGQRVATLPIDEVITETGRANTLKAELTGAAKNALIGGVTGAAAGAAVGAAAGSIVASPVQGALLGATIGGGVGMAGGGIFGGLQGKAAAHNDAENQLSSLSLQTRDANPNYSINGYVFFPKGHYQSLEMKLFDEETREVATLISPLKKGGAKSSLLGTGSASSAPRRSSSGRSASTSPSTGWTGQSLPPMRIE